MPFSITTSWGKSSQKQSNIFDGRGRLHSISSPPTAKARVFEFNRQSYLYIAFRRCVYRWSAVHLYAKHGASIDEAQRVYIKSNLLKYNRLLIPIPKGRLKKETTGKHSGYG